MKRKFVFGAAILILVAGVLLVTDREEDPSKYTKEYFFHKEVNRILPRIRFDNLLAAVLGKDEPSPLIDLDFKRQRYPLSCEVAALSMSLRYLGYNVSEDILLDNLAFSTRGPKKNGIWGDPELGFVGDIKGSVYKGTGYGVYDEPIKDLASKYVSAAALESLELRHILGFTEKKYPVIVWGLLSDKDPISWRTSEGKEVSVYPGEHARVIVGYTGHIALPDEIILMDPLYGEVRMEREKFLSDWNTMERRAVVVYK